MLHDHTKHSTRDGIAPPPLAAEKLWASWWWAFKKGAEKREAEIVAVLDRLRRWRNPGAVTNAIIAIRERNS